MQKVIPVDSVLVPDKAERVFQGKIFAVYQWPQTMFDGSSETFEMLRRCDTVTAICVVDDKILVIDDEQPHFSTRKSFPGGRVDESDADITAAAKREVLEETGYSFKNWRLVRVWQPYRKIEWFIHVLLAWDVASKQQPHPDPGEKITLNILDFVSLKNLVMNKTGYLGENSFLFEHLEKTQDLLDLAEFSGQLIDR